MHAILLPPFLLEADQAKHLLAKLTHLYAHLMQAIFAFVCKTRMSNFLAVPGLERHATYVPENRKIISHTGSLLSSVPFYFHHNLEFFVT